MCVCVFPYNGSFLWCTSPKKLHTKKAYHDVVEHPVMDGEIISTSFYPSVGLKPGTPAFGDFTRRPARAHGPRAEHPCQTRGVLLGSLCCTWAQVPHPLFDHSFSSSWSQGKFWSCVWELVTAVIAQFSRMNASVPTLKCQKDSSFFLMFHLGDKFPGWILS